MCLLPLTGIAHDRCLQCFHFLQLHVLALATTTGNSSSRSTQLRPWCSPEKRPHLTPSTLCCALPTVHRLACLLLPTTTDRLHRLPAAAASPGHLVGAVVLGAELSRAWACSLGLRLDVRQHLALQVPQVAIFLGSKAMDFCTTPLIKVRAARGGRHLLAMEGVLPAPASSCSLYPMSQGGR